MSAPKGHPYGANIRCHPSEAWPANATGQPWPETAGPTDAEWKDEADARRAATAAEAEDKKPGPLYHALAYAPVVLTPSGASGDAKLERDIAIQMGALFQLFKDRQRKYGPGNIAAFGDMGVAVRAQDKLARLRHHYFAGGPSDMPDESVDDAWSDLAVYAVIALVCRAGGWPGWEVGKK